jgi:hypothetical protein
LIVERPGVKSIRAKTDGTKAGCQAKAARVQKIMDGCLESVGHDFLIKSFLLWISDPI